MHYSKTETKKRLQKESEVLCRNEHTPEEEKKNPLIRKRPGDSQIVVTMVLIVIALALCFVFKDQITTFITTAITNMSAKMNALIGNLN